SILAGALGFFLNSVTLPVFEDVHRVLFIFGGIFYLLIALVYGPVYGLIAALIASIRFLMIVGYAHGMMPFGLEGCAVGWLVRRRFAPLIADLLYWSLLGVPLLILIRFFYPGGDSVVPWAIVIKQPVNGLLDVMLVELLLMATPIQRWLVPSPPLVERRP